LPEFGKELEEKFADYLKAFRNLDGIKEFLKSNRCLEWKW